MGGLCCLKKIEIEKRLATLIKLYLNGKRLVEIHVTFVVQILLHERNIRHSSLHEA